MIRSKGHPCSLAAHRYTEGTTLENAPVRNNAKMGALAKIVLKVGCKPRVKLGELVVTHILWFAGSMTGSKMMTKALPRAFSVASLRKKSSCAIDKGAASGELSSWVALPPK